MISYASLYQSCTNFVAYASPKLKGAYAWCQVQLQKGNALRISFTDHQVALKRGAATLTGLFIAWKIYKYWENLPESPQFALVSSLNYARVMIGMPEKEKNKCHIRLVFCIDTSSSMEGKREQQVKEGMKKVLQDAAKRVGDELKMEVAIVGFSKTAHVISHAKILDSNSITSITKEVENYKSNGETSIQAGLVEACEAFKGMEKNTRAFSTLILLTDGGDSTIDVIKGKELSSKVAALGARFFAIGIGSYDKEVLKRLTEEKNIIDTNQGTSIVEAISTLYDRAIAKFQKLRLYCPQLSKEGQWSIQQLFDGNQRWVSEGGKGMTLPELAEGEMREYHLQINLSKLESNIDFAGLVFKLAFEDPRGIQGEVNLYWNGGTIGDRVIISPKRKGECFPQFLKEQNMSF